MKKIMIQQLRQAHVTPELFISVPGVEVCPQKPTNFTCTVNDITGVGALNTRWIGDNLVFDCTNNVITLPHAGSGSLDPVDCGLATGQLQPPDGNNYTSVLTVVPTLEMSGSEFSVQCAFPIEAIVFMNYTASVIGKLPWGVVYVVNLRQCFYHLSYS